MTEEERIEKLLEVLAEGIIYVIIVEKDKNSITYYCKLNEKSDLRISLQS